MKAKKFNKVIGIGFHKTGTSTLRGAMEILGFSVLGPRVDLAEYVFEKNWEKIFKEAENFDVLEDNPWIVIYKELDKRYPNSKFIMTTRDEEKWIDSATKHFGGTTTRMREFIYGEGNGDPQGKSELYLNRYRQHHKEVKEYFKDRPNDLLIVSWAEEHGWDEICSFLDCKKPKKAFPHVNKGKHNWTWKDKTKNFLRQYKPKEQ